MQATLGVGQPPEFFERARRLERAPKSAARVSQVRPGRSRAVDVGLLSQPPAEDCDGFGKLEIGSCGEIRARRLCIRVPAAKASKFAQRFDDLARIASRENGDRLAGGAASERRLRNHRSKISSNAASAASASMTSASGQISASTAYCRIRSLQNRE